MKKINILGVMYTIKIVDHEYLANKLDNYDASKDKLFGVCSINTKRIYIIRGDIYTMNHTLSHELWHAFLHEAGLEKYEGDETLVSALSKLTHRHIIEYEKVINSDGYKKNT